MDTSTSDIQVMEFTPSSNGDSSVLPEVPDQIPEGEAIGTVNSRQRLSHRPLKHASVIPETFPLRPAYIFDVTY
jgi:hypothetical protein